MEKQNLKPIEDLLPRYCEGLTTEEETASVERWLAEDVEHQQMVKQIQWLNLAADMVHVIHTVDTGKALKKVKGRMKVSVKVVWMTWFYRTAAVLFIPLLIGLALLYTDRNTEAEVAQMIEVKTAPGMRSCFLLPDSTRVNLNVGSSLKYPSRFVGDTRQVELVGEAFFDVTRDEKKRFVITTLHQSKIEVYGTSFNVEAYEDNEYISTTLVSGRIGFFSKDPSGEEQEVKLCPKQKLIYHQPSHGVQITQTSDESDTAWKDGKIIFKNTSMEEVIRKLSRHYQVEFLLKSDCIREFSFTGTFSTQSLEEILQYFKMSSGIHWRYAKPHTATADKRIIELY